MKKTLVMKADSPDPLIDAIKDKIFKERRNYTIIVVGPTQTRKSTIAVSICESFDPDFDIQRQMAVSDNKRFMEVLRDDALKKRGKAILLDEFGVGMNHRQWFSFMNGIVNNTLQQHGLWGRLLMVTTPFMSFVDSDALKLFDMMITMESKDDDHMNVTTIVEQLDWNDKLKKMYYKFPRLTNGRRVWRVAAMKIRYPSRPVLDRYYRLSSDAKAGSMQEMSAEIGAQEKKKLRQLFNPMEYVDMIIKEPERFVTEKYYKKTGLLSRKMVSKEKVMNEFLGIGDTRARQIKSLAEEKMGLVGFPSPEMTATNLLKKENPPL